MKLDAIDRRILRAPQRDGRLQNVQLAAEVGLSPSPCLRRVRLLEAAGMIDRYVAVLDPAKVGVGLSLFVRVWLTAQDAETIDRFIAAVGRLSQVVECYIMLGDCDAMLRVVAADLDDYRRFQTAHLTRVNGIQNVKTDLPSQTVKQTYALPVSRTRATISRPGVSGIGRTPREARRTTERQAARAGAPLDCLIPLRCLLDLRPRREPETSVAAESVPVIVS